jgi:hypothetical protein
MIDHWHNVRQEYRQRLPGRWSRVAQALVSAQSRPWRSDPLTVLGMARAALGAGTLLASACGAR